MNAWNIRSFLLQTPKPAKVRLTTEGEIKELDCRKKTMIRIAESIAAIDPELIECLSETDSLLRAFRPGGSQAGDPSSAPVIPEGLQKDANALLLSHFANLIHRSYEHSTEIAFNKIVELVELMGARSDAIERRLERAETAYRREQSERIDDLWERAEELAQASGQPGGREAILDTLIRSIMAGKQARAAGASNGAGTAPPSEPKGAAE